MGLTSGGPDAARFAGRCIGGGALLMLAGVVLGAIGAHGLEGRVTPRQLSSFQTAVLYHQLHALGLVLVGIVAAAGKRSRALHWCAVLLAAGIVFFPGSIYLMTAGAPRWVGMVAPLGGLSFMAAWTMLALHAFRHRG